MVAALLCAATEQPEFAKNDQGKPTSFGVISMVANNQALKIDCILRQRLEPVEYQRRQILCGDSAQFQGDERDVMFLSLVDSPPDEPPLKMRQEGGKKIFKKRFNVAASRARNQMWIVHSLQITKRIYSLAIIADVSLSTLWTPTLGSANCRSGQPELTQDPRCFKER